MSKQIPLDISFPDNCTFERFLVGNNAELVSILQSIDNHHPQTIFFSGQKGSGKTHLLLALCREHPDSIYFPMSEMDGIGWELFEGIAERTLVCLDDIQYLTSSAERQTMLFSLINEMKDRGHSLVCSASGRVAELNISLKDLVSRLMAFANYSLDMPDDFDKRGYIRKEMHRRGLSISGDSIDWIMTRTSRDLPDLLDLIRRIDHESLRVQRRVTIPFIREIVESQQSDLDQ